MKIFQKISKKYLSDIFKKICPDQVFDFNVLPRDSLETKITNEIITLEVDICKFTDEVLNYSEVSKPPLHFNEYNPISDLPSSFKDISYSIKNYSRTQDLQDLLLNFKSDLIKDIYIFDYFENFKAEEIKIGFRFIFQSKTSTITSSEIELIYNKIINESIKIDGVSIPGI